MDSRKLSLLEKAVNTFLDGYWPKEVVEDWRYKKLREASEAALAQQALTCDPVTFHAETHVAAGTQQAQPETPWAVEKCPLHPLCFRISHPNAKTRIHAQHCDADDVIALANHNSP